MGNFKVEFFTKPDGSSPAEDFLDTIDRKMSVKLYKEINLLRDYGNEVREPYSKYLRDGIYELRAQQGSDISRVLYFFYVGRKIILTHGFIKKTNKTPNREIELAKKYRIIYLAKAELEGKK